MCYHDNSEIACIDLHQTGSVGAGSDHLQLIKFWRSCVPGKGVCGGGDFGSALRIITAIADSATVGTAAGAQCLHLFERFFITAANVFCKVPANAMSYCKVYRHTFRNIGNAIWRMI